MSDEMVKIEVRDELVSGIERRVEVSEFGSVEEYVDFVLEEVLRQVGGDGSVDAAEADEDEGAVRSRLEDLGYL